VASVDLAFMTRIILPNALKRAPLCAANLIPRVVMSSVAARTLDGVVA